MAEDVPPPGEAAPGWPYRPAEPDRVRPGPEPPPWAAPRREHGVVPGAGGGSDGVQAAQPSSLLGGGGSAPPPPPARRRRRLSVVAAAVAVLLVAAVTVGVLATRDGGETTVGGADRGGGTTQITGSASAPGGSQAPPSGTGTELNLLAGKVVVAARPGWEALETADNTASVRLALREASGRELLTTMTIATLSDPSSFDSTLKLPGGTSFEVKGTDGPLLVTAQPGPAARIVVGAARPKAAFFVNLSIFALDNKELDVPTLRKLFTEQVAPALRFP